jgi:hypothetical protein
MHVEIIEVDKRLTERYVANTPHSWAMRIGTTESRVRDGTDKAAGC